MLLRDAALLADVPELSQKCKVVAKRDRAVRRSQVPSSLLSPRDVTSPVSQQPICLSRRLRTVDLRLRRCRVADRAEVAQQRELVAKVEHAIELGYEYGSTSIRRRELVEWGERMYGLSATPVGRDPRSGRTVEWRFRVHLPTFLEQLRKLAT